MPNKNILLIEDEPAIRNLLSQILELEGYNVTAVERGIEGIVELANREIQVVITDVKLPDTTGIQLLEKIKSKFPQIEVIVLTAYSNVKDAVQAMKYGAFDYLTKGVDDDKLVVIVERAFERYFMKNKIKNLEERVEASANFDKIIGKSKQITSAIDLAKKVAKTSTTILLLGETGVGKELFAQAIHQASERKSGPFIAINCGAIPKDIQESELFGHKRGAFTGALYDKKGVFEEATSGTLFLDEIGEMSLDLQVKLLRALESRTINRVGDSIAIPIDVRIIAATNRNLLLEVEENRFRQDLYYRVNTFAITIPTLNERKDDIELLTKFFLQNLNETLGKKIENVSSGFMAKLKLHKWFGNIRELKNIIERAVILCDSNELTEDLLPDEFNYPFEELRNITDDIEMSVVEKKHIIKILQSVENNKPEAAKLLGIGLTTLYRKLKEYGLE